MPGKQPGPDQLNSIDSASSDLFATGLWATFFPASEKLFSSISISFRLAPLFDRVSRQFRATISLRSIVIGDLSPSKLKKTRMAKSVSDAALSTFRHMLHYKAIRHNGRMIEVDERYTTQTCSACRIMPEGRPRGIAGLGIREWTCDGCGVSHDRDVNAARNILRLGLETLVEGAGS